MKAAGQDATKADVAELTDRLRRIENLLSAPHAGTQFTCTRSRSADDQPVITSMITGPVSPETPHPRNGLWSKAKAYAAEQNKSNMWSVAPDPGGSSQNTSG
jgi:hypothetical protein